MWPWDEHLKLGKTPAFVKRDLRLLALIFSLCGAKQEAHVCRRPISIAREIAKSLSEALDIDAPPSPNPG